MNFESISPSVLNAAQGSPEGVEAVANITLTPLSAAQIRSIRHSFEQDNQNLNQTLNSNEHQSLMVTMYETTEQLINKPINPFDLVQHLESLKHTAQELHKQGLPLESFRSKLFQQSQDSIVSLITPPTA